MIRMSFKICVIIVVLFGSVRVGAASNLKTCSSPFDAINHNCFGTVIMMAANTLVSLRMANGMGEASTSGPKATGGFHSMKG